MRYDAKLPIWLFAAASSAGVAAFSVVDTLYFREIGFTLQQIGLFTAVFSLSSALAEFPSALVFDMWSNKRAIQLGNLIRIVAFTLFFLATTQGEVVLAEVVAGVGAAAMSGTLHALLMNQVEDSQRFSVLTKLTGLSSATALLGGLAGMLVFMWSPRWVWLLAVAFFLLAGIAMAFAADDRHTIERQPISAFTRSAFSALRTRGCWVLALLSCAVVIPLMLWQLRLGGTVSLGSVLLAFILMKVAGLAGPWLSKRLNLSEKHFPSVMVLNCLALTGFGFPVPLPVATACFFIHVLCHILMTVMVNSIFHSELDSRTRATAGSIATLVETGMVAVVAPLGGFLANEGHLERAVLLAVGLYAAALIVDIRR